MNFCQKSAHLCQFIPNLCQFILIFRRFILAYIAQATQADAPTPIIKPDTRIPSKIRKKIRQNPNFFKNLLKN